MMEVSSQSSLSFIPPCLKVHEVFVAENIGFPVEEFGVKCVSTIHMRSML